MVDVDCCSFVYTKGWDTQTEFVIKIHFVETPSQKVTQAECHVPEYENIPEGLKQLHLLPVRE